MVTCTTLFWVLLTATGARNTSPCAGDDCPRLTIDMLGDTRELMPLPPDGQSVQWATKTQLSSPPSPAPPTASTFSSFFAFFSSQSKASPTGGEATFLSRPHTGVLPPSQPAAPTQSLSQISSQQDSRPKNGEATFLNRAIEIQSMTSSESALEIAEDESSGEASFWAPSSQLAAQDPSQNQSAAQSATNFSSLLEFQTLARRGPVPGAAEALKVMFLIVGLDTQAPILYFINTNTFHYHYDFATSVLAMRLSQAEFDAQTYFTQRRKNVAGTIVYYERFDDGKSMPGLFAVEFWPADPVSALHTAIVQALVKRSMKFATDRLAYHPTGETQTQLFQQQKADFDNLQVRVIESNTLFHRLTYIPLIQGGAFGQLRILDSASAKGVRPPTTGDICIFQSMPDDLPRVAGLISETPQTPLADAVLKAKQDRTPTAFVRNATSDPRFLKLIGKYVYLKVGSEGLEIMEAKEPEEPFLDVGPTKIQPPPLNLRVDTITSLNNISFADSNTFGSKASNVGELRRFLPAGVVPDGFAIPFSFYSRFMLQTGLVKKAQKMIGGNKFQKDAKEREKDLDDFRKKVKKEKMPLPLAMEIKKIYSELRVMFGPKVNVRCRSSASHEDLPGFGGAGLYDSYTHRFDEGDLDKTIRSVYASMWNFRAFEEREFLRIDHFGAAMGVFLHPNEDDEQSNGVAYTKNVYDPNFPAFYVNAQIGEETVTGTAEALLISRLGEHGEYEIQYITKSSLSPDGSPVLSRPHVGELVVGMELIHGHFRDLYKPTDPSFAMDIEFKVRADNTLQIKQARPITA